MCFQLHQGTVEPVEGPAPSYLVYKTRVPARAPAWNGWWESNPLLMLGRRACHHQHLTRLER